MITLNLQRALQDFQSLDTDQYQKYSDACFVIAIGNAAVREKLVDKLKNVSWYTANHPTAVISELGVSIGEGTGNYECRVNAGARIEDIALSIQVQL